MTKLKKMRFILGAHIMEKGKGPLMIREKNTLEYKELSENKMALMRIEKGQRSK